MKSHSWPNCKTAFTTSDFSDPPSLPTLNTKIKVKRVTQKGVILRIQILVTEGKSPKVLVDRQKEIKVINSSAFCWEVRGEETNTLLASTTRPALREGEAAQWWGKLVVLTEDPSSTLQITCSSTFKG